MLKVCMIVMFLSSWGLAGPVENGALREESATGGQERVPDLSLMMKSTSTSSAQKQQVFDVFHNNNSYMKENDFMYFDKIEESLIQKLNVKCAKKDSSSCAMLKLISYMNRLLKKSNIDVMENIEITQTSPILQSMEDLPRSISQESEESQMADLISAKLLSFVRSRALRLRLLPTTEAVITSIPDSNGNLHLGMSIQKVSDIEGRGKQKNMGGLLAAMVMKMGMLTALAFKGLVLLVGKALLVSKIALLLAVILGLKKLFSQQQKHVTYEVVAQPHHSHAHVEHIDHGHSNGGGGGHDSYSSGWGRSSDYMRSDAHLMAYRGYAPRQ